MPATRPYGVLISGIAVLVGLYLIGLKNYLLFHGLAEAFSIVVSCGIFMVAWNVRRTLDNSYLMVLGIAYLFVAGLDLLHALAYRGMNVFPGHETNLPTQLWIAARYMESISLLIAPLFIGRRVKIGPLFSAYGTGFFFAVLSIFVWKVFPDCFIEGLGLTLFKRTSEYVICLILATSLLLLFKRRDDFDKSVFRLLVISISLTIASELFFTFYAHAYGLSNLFGHLLKIASCVFIYRALIVTGLHKPYKLLSGNLKKGQLALKRSEERYRNLVESLQEGIWVLNDGWITEFVNPRLAQMLGYSEKEMHGRHLSFFMEESGLELCNRNVESHGIGIGENHDFELIRKDGTSIHALIKASPMADDLGKHIGTIAAVTDITERKHAEEGLKWELEVNASLSLLYPPLISALSKIEDISDIVLREAKALTSSTQGYVSSIDPETGRMVPHTLATMTKAECALIGKDTEVEFPRGNDGRYNALWGHSLNTRESFFVHSPLEHPASKGTPEGHILIRSFLSVPVVLGDELVGQISLANKKGDYADRDLRAVERLATYYALAIQHKRAEAALIKAHESLEIRVRERTQDLAQANKELRKQIRDRRKAEEALRESEKKYSTLIEQSLTGVFIQQEERIVFANERFAQMHGYTKEEIMGIESLNLIYPDDRAMVRKYREDRMHGKDVPSEYETRGLTKDGKVIWEVRRNTLITYGGRPAVLGNAADITQRKRMEAALIASGKGLRKLSAQLFSAEENERKRIAQELHDSIGQSLGAIKFSLENVINRMSGGAALAEAGLMLDIIPLTQKAIEEVRRIVMDLRPSTLDDLGILPTISWFCRQFQDVYSGIRIETGIEIEEEDVPDSLKTVIYRILQETLNNIAKHSRASRVRLSLKKAGEDLELFIEDNGVGFDVGKTFAVETDREGFGLASMKERAELSGGIFIVSSTRGEGTKVRATWPIEPGESIESIPASRA
ncbi:MAG: MASE3 domain-containing protein [Desulfatiglandales bacterium]